MAFGEFFEGRERVIDSGSIHEELHAKADEHGEVAVFGGDGADDDAGSQSEACH